MPAMRTLIAIVLSLLALPAATAQRAADTVLKKDGARIRGVEVTALTLQGLQWKRGSETGEVPAYHVQSVEWGEAPDAFVSARAALERGDFEAAKQLFGEAAANIERPVLKLEARYLQCRAAAAAAAVDPSTAAAAAGSIRALLAEAPDSFRVPELLLLLGRSLRLGGLGADAEAELKQLDSRTTAEGWPPIWGARAKLEIALAQMAQNRPTEARSSFQAAGMAAENALNTPGPDDTDLRALRTSAKVGEGETYVAEQAWARAIDYFRTLASAQPDLKAAAKAGEGQALYLQAAATNNAEDLRKAQLALAEASVLDGVGGETSARANYFLGKCLLALGSEREGETFKARATNYFQIVVRNYANTRWAAEARAELAR